MNNLAQGFPIPSAPLVEPTTGIVTSQWLNWFQNQYRRSGGAGGPSLPADQVATLASDLSGDGAVIAAMADGDAALAVDLAPVAAAAVEAQTLAMLGDVPDVHAPPDAIQAFAMLAEVVETPADPFQSAMLADPQDMPDLDQPTLLALALSD